MCLSVKKSFLTYPLLFFGLFSNAQEITHLDADTAALSISKTSLVPGSGLKVTPDKKRVFIITATNVSIWTISFIALNKSWYADYPKSSFHFFNDNAEWNQIDKAGHLWTNYHVTRLSSEMWKWTGLPEKKSVILGGISGIAYQSIIEIQDGFSQAWGFSWGDMAANVAGAAAFVSQELAWKEQRVQFKLSYWPYDYPGDLHTRRNQLFGKSGHERILKDYNSQTYWASVNLAKFFPASSLPRWLNISIGYGSDGMYGGTQNTWTDKTGNSFDRTDIRRMRRFYLSPDVDLTEIKTKSGLLKTVFYVLNMVKFPAPALEVNSVGKVRFHYVKF
ncbi:MAG: DUF2279 domain-containing protein [Chitinophagaceae bacterium]